MLAQANRKALSDRAAHNAPGEAAKRRASPEMIEVVQHVGDSASVLHIHVGGAVFPEEAHHLPLGVGQAIGMLLPGDPDPPSRPRQQGGQQLMVVEQPQFELPLDADEKDRPVGEVAPVADLRGTLARS